MFLVVLGAEGMLFFHESPHLPRRSLLVHLSWDYWELAGSGVFAGILILPLLVLAGIFGWVLVLVLLVVGSLQSFLDLLRRG